MLEQGIKKILEGTKT